MDGALDGIRVADFTQMMQGGWAAQKLGDMGADVVKIEPPDGEFERQIPSAGGFIDGESIKFLVMNRNKRSIAIDLKTDEGQAIVGDIVRDADILMENFRPGVMDRLGLSYESVREINPEIVYVSASGYGSDGPYRDRPGQDLLIQAESGLAAITGRSQDPPTPNGTYVADELSANLMAFHTVLALFHRERTGQGQKVEGNLLDSLIDAMCQEFATHINQDVEYERGIEQHGNVVAGAPYGIYETADGHVAISLAPIEQLEEALNVDLSGYDSAEALYANRDEVHERIEAETRERSTENLLEIATAADIWMTRVRDVAEATEHPQAEYNDSFVEVDHPRGGTFTMPGFPVSMSETPGEVRHRPPLTGEHTREIVAELGYEQSRIEALIEDDVLVSAG